MDKPQQPVVSVIIPAFNAAGSIRQTLNSVLAQTYQSFEVIVVDDGSSDATSAIVQEFVTKDVRFQLVQQRNAGVGAARNAAIRKARGKYIAPLDADDLWFPEKLEKQVACFEKYGDETGLVYCWSTLINKQGEFVDIEQPYTFEGRLRHALVLHYFFSNASVPLFRAAALQQAGLYLTRSEQDGAQGCEDWDLSLRIAEILSIRVVPECLVAYRRASSSMSANVDGMAASFAVFTRRARQRNCDLPPVAFRWSAGYFYRNLASKCFGLGHYSGCLDYLKEAVSANPVLLLTAATYKAFIKSVIKLVTAKTGNHHAEQLLSIKNKEKGSDLPPNIKKKSPLISNWIFKYVEGVRWSAALADQT